MGVLITVSVPKDVWKFMGVLNYCLNFPRICAFYHKSAQILR